MRTLAGAVWLLLAAPGSAAEEPIGAWLPGETLFCLSVESPPRTALRLAAGRYADLKGHPAAQRIAVESKALLARAREAGLDRGEVWLGPFWELAEGPILLAVVRAQGREAPLVVMDAGEEDRFAAHLERLADAGVLGDEVLHEYRGERVRVRHGGEGAGAVSWIGRGGVVAFSWRREAVEVAVDQLRGGGRGLAPRLEQLRARLRADADALLLLPREALRELEERNPDLLALGLGDDASVGMTIALDPDALDVRAFVFAPRPRRGLLALLDEPNGPLEPPAFLPADTRAVVAARFDLARVLAFAGAADPPPLAKRFVRALGDRFALARVGDDEVFLAEVEREAWMRRLLSVFPGTGDGVHMGPDGAVAMRDGWLVAAPGPDAVRRLLAEPARAPAAEDTLPKDRILLWRLRPAPPRGWDDPMRLFDRQEGAVRNEADGLLLVHRALLR